MQVYHDCALRRSLAVRVRTGNWALLAIFVWLCVAPLTAQTTQPARDAEAATNVVLPDVPASPDSAESTPTATLPADSPNSAPQSESFIGAVGAAGKTIGQDEWHFIKAPFHKKAIVWDALFLGATGVLIANDESVLYAIPSQWHATNRDISNGALYGSVAVAGGIYLTGLFTKDEHSQEVGIRTAEATVDSVILYGAMKAIFQRQRPYSGPGEGRFFAGNWTNGSFPSGPRHVYLDDRVGRRPPISLHPARHPDVRHGRHGDNHSRAGRSALSFRRFRWLGPRLPHRRLCCAQAPGDSRHPRQQDIASARCHAGARGDRCRVRRGGRGLNAVPQQQLESGLLLSPVRP